ncbi:hypothetical protein [Sagittula stellata]|uniref:Uncharacterized protein n=1 Tax=Sagittula stellata (strain ATCC 700073 / DSM 11524 / E-37) TaxID=388399 RepID=A3K8F2_SAGS3|nr:hypothetical protein [Sagittula stellata]EBA06631.1 hypothetical protein SSE37_10258 [Sagittula stellata E-37]
MSQHHDDQARMILGAALLAEARANPGRAGKLLWALRGDLARATRAADAILARLAEGTGDGGATDAASPEAELAPDAVRESTGKQDRQARGGCAIEL